VVFWDKYSSLGDVESQMIVSISVQEYALYCAPVDKRKGEKEKEVEEGLLSVVGTLSPSRW